MKIQYNPIQLQGIQELSKSILLSAGAGSGKTDVLTRRIVEILKTYREEPLRILAITFTKKATEEMNVRLMKILKEEGLKNQDFQKVSIQTIDSFCESLLREYNVAVSLSPDFQIIEEFESDLLLGEIIHEVVFTHYQRQPEIFTHLRSQNLNVGKWEGELLFLYKEMRQKKIGELARRDCIEAPSLSELETALRNLYTPLMENLSGNSNLKKLLKGEEGARFYERDMTEEELIGFFGKMQETKFPTIKEEKVSCAYSAFLDQIALYKERGNDEFIQIHHEVLEEIEEKFQEKKRQGEILDFADLLSYALALFNHSEIRKEITSRYDFILVDEFQDTNPRQVEMVKAFQSQSNIFLVGDMKQSIYGFRGANLKNVMEAQQEFQEGDFISLTLADNYRSTSEIIDYINSFFQEKMKGYVPLKAHQSLEGSSVQYVNLKEWDLDPHEAEATFIAQEAKKYLEAEKTVALLVRRKTHLATYERVFRAFALPFINYSSDGLFQTPEVKMLKNILLALSKPKDSMALIGFYRSPLIGLNNSSIYQILKEQSHALSEEERERFESANNMLMDLQDVVRPITALLDRIYEDYKLLEMTEDFYRLSARENLLEVRKIAEKFDQDKGEDLSAFLLYWSHFEKIDVPQAGPPMTKNVLEIMTIHKAKGLQFDAVFLGDMSYGSGRDGNRLNFTNEYGIGLNSRDGANFIYRKNRDIQAALDQEEELRLLYVAMTRAKENLYLLESKEEKTPSGFLQYFEEEEKIVPAQEPVVFEASPKQERTRGRGVVFEIMEEKPVYSPSQIFLLPEEETTLPDTPFTEQAANVGSFLHQYAALKEERREARELILRRGREELSENDLLHLQSLMETYDRFDAKGKVLATEIPLFVEFPDFRIKGFMDQIREMNGQRSLVDLKTGKSTTPSRHTYENQIQLYGLSYEKLYGEKLPLYLYFLGNDELISVENLSYEELYEKIHEILTCEERGVKV